MSFPEPDFNDIVLKPLRPLPLSILARQLEFLFLGIPTSTIFCFEGDLVQTIDPAHPPPGIPPNSTQAFLLARFLSLPTRRACTVKDTYDHNGLKRRCGKSCCGFIEILKHQRQVHKRTRHYICVVEECMALFDKIGNARRHASTIHSRAALRRRQATQAHKRYEMQRVIGAAQMRADHTRDTYDLMESSNHAHLDYPRRDTATSLKQRQKKNGSVLLRLRLTPPVLHLSSTIKHDLITDTVRIQVINTPHTQLDVGCFHKQHVRRGRFHGFASSTLQLEWVAVAALMDLHYGWGRVRYSFKKGLLMVKKPLKTLAPALPVIEGTPERIGFLV